ncbi:MAG TPA: gas vesicle protein GvpJ [Nocardioidaceae bacterium]|nr:gas vesicle protein GvpJ [Nocardioidaceae bacterium]
MAQTRHGGGYLDRPAPSGLADVVEVILDKGLVIDAYVRVSLVGIELLTIDARIVIASVDTYLRFAEATNRLDLYEKGGKDLPEMVEGMASSGAKGKTSGVLGAAKDAIMGSDDDEDEEDEQEEERPRRPRKSSSSSRQRRTRERES